MDEASATSRLKTQAYISPFVTLGQAKNPIIPAWPPLCLVLCRHSGPTGSCKAAGAAHCGKGLKPPVAPKPGLGVRKSL